MSGVYVALSVLVIEQEAFKKAPRVVIIPDVNLCKLTNSLAVWTTF